MKFLDITNEEDFLKIRELAPAMPSTQAPQAGAQTLGSTQQVQQDPQAQAKMMAQQALDRANRKKEVQELIKQKQQELADLQKELASIK